MSLAPIITGVGVAAGAVVTGAANAIGNGLSFAAELARKPLGSSSPPANPPAEEPSPEQRLEELKKQFRQRLEERLKSIGVSLAQPVVLEASPSGTLRVKNDHPQWRSIEQALGEDESFASQFAELQSAVAATGEDPVNARRMAIELSADGLRVLTPH